MRACYGVTRQDVSEMSQNLNILAPNLSHNSNPGSEILLQNKQQRKRGGKS